MPNLAERPAGGKRRGGGRPAAAARLALWILGAAAWAFALVAGGAGELPVIAVLPDGAPGVEPLWADGCLPIIASSRGKSYYFSWCEQAANLSPANLRHFCSTGEAEGVGYRPAKGCVEAR